ncbi:MAG: RNA polymerase sigma factor [Bryobacteraceae bacterium]
MASPEMISLSPDEELPLIAAAVAGDRDAWQRLVDLYSPILKGTIRSRLEPDDAEEALQNAWLRIFSSLEKYDPNRAPFIAFCRWHATNAAIDVIRRKRRMRQEVAAEDLGGRQGFEGDREPLDWLASTQSWEEAASMERFDEEVAPQLREAIYSQFLQLAFSLPRPPHELICYGFNKLLEWEPRRIVSDLGPEALKGVLKRLETELEEKSSLEAGAVEACFEALRQRLRVRLKDLLTDRRTQRRYQALLDRVVAGTLLREYFSSDPAADISAWWWGVQRRLVAEAEAYRTPDVDRILEKIG